MKNIFQTIAFVVLFIFCILTSFYILTSVEEDNGQETVNVSAEENELYTERNTVLIENSFDTIMFNKETNCPDYVAWKITPDRLNNKKYDRDEFKFSTEDSELLPEANKVCSDDYTNSGYDRGHMSPACDNTFSRQAMKDCMEMDNIVPQTEELNRGSWKKLEEKCRRYAEKNGHSVYVVCGPLYTNWSSPVIGRKHSVKVPDKCFKCIVYRNKKNVWCGEAYLFENNKNASQQRVSIDDIEKYTKYDFFQWLSDSTETRIEAY